MLKKRLLFMRLALVACLLPSVCWAVKVAGVGYNGGNQEANQIFPSGDLPGSITRISVATFNAMSPAALRASSIVQCWYHGLGVYVVGARGCVCSYWEEREECQ